MKLDIERGILYDTLRVFDIYFNYETVLEELEARGSPQQKEMEFYHKITEKYKIDEDLYAFFVSNKQTGSYMTAYYLKNIKEIHSIHAFLELIQCKPAFYNDFKHFFFGTVRQSADISYQDIVSLDLDCNTKICISFILKDYEYYISKLCKSLHEVYLHTCEIYNRNVNKILGFSLDSGYQTLLKSIPDYSSADLDNSVYCISLLHPFSLCSGNFSTPYLVLGYLCKKTIESYNLYHNVTIQSMCGILSNDLSLEIINIIHEHKEMKPSAICKILQGKYQVSTSTVHRLVKDLMDEKVIQLTKRTNKCVYYSINYEYFTHTRAILDAFLERYKA